MALLFPILASSMVLAPSAESVVGNKVDAARIVSLERALGRAMIARDTGALSRIVGDDWLCQGASGISTKKTFVDDVATGKLVVRRFVLHDVHVRVMGNVAYLMAADDEESAYAGTDNSGTYNWLDVWQKRGGRWVSVATQITKVRAGS